MGDIATIIGVIGFLVVLYLLMRLRLRMAREYSKAMRASLEAKFHDPKFRRRAAPIFAVWTVLALALILAAGLSPLIPLNARLGVYTVLFLMFFIATILCLMYLNL